MQYFQPKLLIEFRLKGLETCYFEFAELYQLTNNIENAITFIEKNLELIKKDSIINKKKYSR